MRTGMPQPHSLGDHDILTALLAGLALIICMVLMPGCGAMSSQPAPSPPQAGTAQVVVLLSSTADDVLWQFYVALASLTLTDSAGNSVSVYSNSATNLLPLAPAEFIHLNGITEPRVTATLPRGTYTLATVKVRYCNFSTAGANSSGGPEISTSAEGTCAQGRGDTTINLPTPITISDSGNVLSLNLQVPQSYTQSQVRTSSYSYTISPAFTLTQLQIADPPSNQQNGLIPGVNAQIVSTSAGGFTVQDADGAPWPSVSAPTPCIKASRASPRLPPEGS